MSVIGSVIVGILSTFIIALLGVLIANTNEIKRDLKEKVNREDCSERHKLLREEGGELWHAINTHGHTQNGRVTRS